MILNTQINKDGTLNIRIPEFLWGKKVIISIKEESEIEPALLQYFRKGELYPLFTPSGMEDAADQLQKFIDRKEL